MRVNRYRDSCSYITRHTWRSMMMVPLLVSHQRVADSYQNRQQHYKRNLQMRRHRLFKILPLSMQLDRSLLMMPVPSVPSMRVALVFVCAVSEMRVLRMPHRRFLGFVIVLCHRINWLPIISRKIIKICLPSLSTFLNHLLSVPAISACLFAVILCYSLRYYVLLDYLINWWESSYHRPALCSPNSSITTSPSHSTKCKINPIPSSQSPSATTPTHSSICNSE